MSGNIISYANIIFSKGGYKFLPCRIAEKDKVRCASYLRTAPKGLLLDKNEEKD